MSVMTTYNREYYLKNRDRCLGHDRLKYIKFRDKILERNRSYYNRNQDRLRIKAKVRYYLRNGRDIPELLINECNRLGIGYNNDSNITT